VDCEVSIAEQLNFLRLIKNAQVQGAPAFADLPAPAEAGGFALAHRSASARRRVGGSGFAQAGAFRN